ncbi:MAG: type I-E CRISPR-associated protein Cas7/Cse4/CasC [Eubacteriales bacterium]|nr:type I-E CRISPR-associated protein Cas7/Cse4/CasC [Eubacteriales bacterium]
MNKRLYLDFHIIQTVPPSCVNRDDTGSPKTARYGGVTRARVSSQSWKRAIRMMFADIFQDEVLAQRTKKIVPYVSSYIKMLDSSIDDTKAEKLAMEALKNAGLKIKSAEKGTDALFFLSSAQAEALAKLSVGGETDKKKYSEALKEHPSIDMAFFGRMVASDPSLNYDATAQVAHSISTHEIQNEYDYFTAVDDCMPEDNAGAGHVGTIEFNSSTLYRYATLNVHELRKHLQQETPAAIRGFAEAFIRSMPTGKQNTFANRTFPDMIYVTIRTDQPVNLVGAFEQPVRSTEGYVKPSIKALVSYANDIYAKFGATPEQAFAVGNGLEALVAETITLPELLDSLENIVKEVE